MHLMRNKVSRCSDESEHYQKLKLKKREIINRENTLEAGLPVFREAVSAIDGPSLSWLERYFAFLSTV